MPFQSKAQETYLSIHEPAVAKEFAKATPPNAKLPEHVTSSKKQPTPERKSAAMKRLVEQDTKG